MAPRARILTGAIICLTPCLVAWWFISTYDLEVSWRTFLAGRGIVAPPRRPGVDPNPGSYAVELGAEVASALLPALVALLVTCTALILSRLRHRRRRADTTTTWELRLGRDDLAAPYRVQEALEGLLGGLSARWYERLWRGQDHLAFEAHRLPDETVRFTAAAPQHLDALIRAGIGQLYPDVQLTATAGRPTWTGHIARLKKRRSFEISLQTVRDYEHAFSESLASQLDALRGELTFQVLITPAPAWVHRRARKLLKKRERTLQYADRRDAGELGIDSVVEYKELKGALETQHRSLAYTEIRIAGAEAASVRMVAGLAAQLRSENELVRRELHIRRALYAARLRRAIPNPIPGLATGILSTSELATLWQLPRGRLKHTRLVRASVRRAVAPPEIERDQDHAVLWDERGPVSLAPAARVYGHAVLGGQNAGKSSLIARHFANDARDRDRAIVLIDPKGDLARLCRGIAPADRVVHYLAIDRPEVGFNPLAVATEPHARADMFIQALVDAHPLGAIQAASDSFLRQALTAVCAVEAEPTTWHVYLMLLAPDYRASVIERLSEIPGTEFVQLYWQQSFPELLESRRSVAEKLNPPRNKLERLLGAPPIDRILRHPAALDIAEVISRREILIVAGDKFESGEENTKLVFHLLLHLVHTAIQAQQSRPAEDRRTVSLMIDEAHNVLVPFVHKMLSEGRSGGLEAVFAWQHSNQIRDENVRSGVRSLLQSISIFRMREMEDARSFAGLAMDIYTDRISVNQDEQDRFRFSPEDILRLPDHQAWNLWHAGGRPASAFRAGTHPMQELYDQALADHHIAAQQERGGHYPGPIPNPIPDDTLHHGEGTTRGDGSDESPSRRPKPRRARPRRKPPRADPDALRLPLPDDPTGS